MIALRIRQIVTLLVCLIGFSAQSSLQVDKTLPPLKSYTHVFRAEDPVNVTMGEQFSIGVSQFDIQNIPDDLKVFQISQQKFINMFQTLQKHESSGQENSTKKEVDRDIFSCAIRRPSMEVVRTLNVFTQKSAAKFTLSSQKSVIYVPIRSRQLLYTLDTGTLELQVYHFTSQKMNFLSSAKINGRGNGQKIAMASGSSEDHIFVFSSQGMWSIATKTVLTNVQRLAQGLSGFNSVRNPVDKLYHGAYGFIFGLKRHLAVYLISEEGRVDANFTTISKFNDIPLIPQDLWVDSRLLYVLDMHQGVFVFHILGTGDVVEFDHITWRSFGNLELIAKESSLFIRYMDQEEQKIVEINYNSEKHEAGLVRYYKTDQVVSSFSLQTVPVSSTQRAYTINEPLIFLIADTGEIEAFPYNVDPRMVNNVHNGAKMYVEGVTDLIYLYEDLYVIVTSENLLYTRIRIQKPELVCLLKQSTGHVYYQIQFSSNISTCQNYDPSLEHKVRYNYNCRLIANYMIYVDDPDLSRFQKGVLYGVVFLVVASFIFGLLCLIQWRNNQLSLIGRIKDEIIKLRDRYRKMQPFTEEEPDHPKNSVQFQLPEALPIPDS